MSDLDVPDSEYTELQAALGYEFRESALLVQALTHPSWCQTAPGRKRNNQRLEFLGDAVLGMILAEELYRVFPNKREGVLTRNRSVLAKGNHLTGLAIELGLPEHLLLSEAEERNGGRERPSILEDGLEALIGAIYLDSDFLTTQTVVRGWIGDLEARLTKLLGAHNPKGRLQEYVQPELGNGVIEYRMAHFEGPDHAREFTVEVLIQGELAGVGVGASKKEAEEAAALKALARYESEGEE